MISFDIETSSLPREQLLERIPEFDPDQVKTGNLKDPAKIQTKIDEARAVHVDNYLMGAALHAHTGYVLAIGFATDDGKFAIDYADGGQVGEADLLAGFWERVQRWRASGQIAVTLNGNQFDLPFLCRRSFVNSVPVPDWVLQKNRYWHPMFVDLREVWLCGQFGGNTKSSFDTLAAAFGTAGKLDGVSGKDFARLWFGSEEDRREAIRYLEEDVKQPLQWAKQMGVA